MTGVVALADEYWDYFRSSAQLWNIDRGDVEQIEYWENLSAAGVTNRIDQLNNFAKRVGRLSSDGLSEREHALVAAVQFSAGATAATLPFERDLALVAGPFNFATFVAALVPGYSLVTTAHGDGYITKLRAMPAFVDGWIDGLRQGASVGRAATARGVAAALESFESLLRTELVDDPLASQPPPSDVSPAEVADWRNSVLAAIRDAARPAIARLCEFLRDEILPVGRADDRAGICSMVGGDEAYESLLWAATSTDLTSGAVHQLGLEQLALLDDEYRLLGPGACGVADPSKLRDRLRTDPALRYTSADEIIADALATLARSEAAAPQWFTRLPNARCNAVALNAGPLAYYTGPSPDGSRPGAFFYNVGDPSAWTRYQLEATTFHEAIPGHHLQLALAQEAGLHPVLGELEVASYGEGWGLYAERLADEMSLYSSPLQRVGMLTLDSLRAARLVVDTGLHAMGWTREQAINFMVAHTSHDRRNVEAEVDRYIATPGQATSYMVGRLEIQRLRRHAEQQLGERFKIGDFHNVVLGNGMTPLNQLARTIEAWLQRS